MSVEAVQPRLICADETAVAVRLVGAEGGVVSVPAAVVAEAIAE